MYRMSSTANLPFLVEFISPTLHRPFPLTEMMSPVLTVVLFFSIVVQLTRTSPLLIKAAILEREILNPALAMESSLREASTVFIDLVLGGSYSRASNGILLHVTVTFPTLSKDEVR